MVRKTTLAISVSALLASAAPAFASFDMEDCKWSDEHCLLKGDPVLTPGNDSRDNLLRLLSEAKSFTLPVQSIPADITRSRDVYFAYHPEWDDLEDPAPAAVDKPAEESPLNKQWAALQLEPVETHQDGEQENRFVSNNAGSLSQFFAALLADDSLTAEQRHALAQARLGLYAGASDEQISASLATLPADSAALLYKTYLTGAARFYAGDYEGADRAFVPLIDSDRPWLAETAHYMLMRTALNKSSQNSMGEYGDFTIDRIDRPAAEQVQAGYRIR